MSECTHNCDTCSAGCASKEVNIEKLKLGKGSKIKKIIGVSSGKGGVGKSFVTSLIASGLQKKGYKVGILDADILGPSIPKSFGVLDKNVLATDNGLMIPKETRTGIKIISSNLMLENDTEPIIYRGALISGLLQQFYQEVDWGELDFLFIDMPPGTGDVPLTTYQSIPIDKVIIVSSPQSLVSMIVSKSINMADKMDIDILGIVENMSYVVCPNCDNKIEIFGKSNIDEVADENDTIVLAKLPMRVEYSKMVDEGMVEDIDISELDSTIDMLVRLVK
ncbi:MAG: P-loop NTPase [Lachnospiraceae bacterium]|nr:P-loop NTPase [Lachnospiraceae bacterium]